MDLLQRLARERGRAVAIVTHDNRMVGYGDRIVTMEDGRIVSDERKTLRPGSGQAALEGAVA
jgi:ABC-type lipoprotein export system ATPase subunit